MTLAIKGTRFIALLLMGFVTSFSGCQPQIGPGTTVEDHSHLTEVSATAPTNTPEVDSAPQETIQATLTPTAIPVSPTHPRPTRTPTSIPTPTPSPSISALEGWLVFASRRVDTNGDGVIGVGDGQHLYTLELATDQERSITSGEYFDTEPSWSSDGMQIVFSSNRSHNGSFDLFVINRDGSDLRQLTNIPDHARRPSWSPNGDYIAFEIGHIEESGYETKQIGLYSIAESYVRQVTTGVDTFENSGSPSWSSDGRYLAFSHISNSLLNSSQYTVNIDFIDMETFERFTLAREDELTYRPTNPQWVPGERYILAWEAHLGNVPDLLLFELHWQENEPVLEQLPVGLTDLLGGFQSWTTNGEWLIYQVYDNTKPDANHFIGWEIAAMPINLPHLLSSSDGRMGVFSVLNMGGLKLLTDNHFLDSNPSWTPE